MRRCLDPDFIQGLPLESDYSSKGWIQKSSASNHWDFSVIFSDDGKHTQVTNRRHSSHVCDWWINWLITDCVVVEKLLDNLAFCGCPAQKKAMACSADGYGMSDLCTRGLIRTYWRYIQGMNQLVLFHLFPRNIPITCLGESATYHFCVWIQGMLYSF